MRLEELNKYYDNFKYGEDIFHNLMRHKIRNVLLISSIFDAYILEQDGILSEQLYGEYKQMNILDIPQITTVSFTDDIKKTIREKDFDAVIIMMRVGSSSPHYLCREIKEIYPELPVLLLLNKQSYVEILSQYPEKMSYFDEVFLWHGDTKLYFAMIKSEEDKMNVEADTEIGDIRIVLFIESAIDYYSSILPLIYSAGLNLTQELIQSEKYTVNKRLRMRARPKVLMAHDFENAVEIFQKYKDNILCVISNANLKIKGNYDPKGGIKLLHKFRDSQSELPLLIQSADENMKKFARELDAKFLYKYSPTLMHELRDFITNNLGFGDFVFRDDKQNEIARARSIFEFEKELEKIAIDSILYHARKNHFSAWLLAHSEVQMAKEMRKLSIEDFHSTEEIRDFVLKTIHEVRKKQNRGRVIQFDEAIFTEDDKIVQLAEGSMGGKGRGLAFLNALLVSLELENKFGEVKIRIPKTAIIGTNEFDDFLENNHLDIDELVKKNDDEINDIFLQGRLTAQLRQRLKILLQNFDQPLAVRSSGLLEDSQSQPFAGIYDTLMLPNNHPEPETRLHRLCEAIKVVLSSPFRTQARRYIESINFKINEEKMAVIIQEVAGSEHKEKFFYPNFSGAAQSYNFYPISHMKHNEGIVSLAAGLGKSVVDGERAFRFCPKHPRIDLMEPTKIVENNQEFFYGIDKSIETSPRITADDVFVKRIKVRSSHKEDVFKAITSVWDYKNLEFLDGKFIRGPRVFTFRNVIHYNHFPLPEILNLILEMGQIALGIPVEIEFAVDLKNQDSKAIFYLLQIRPLSLNKERIEIDQTKIKREEMMLITNKGMGNGIYQDIKDVIYIDPEKFDNTQTLQMVSELEELNRKLEKNDRNYILIGPGRWGSSDRFLGIPVKWSQINRAKVIVEASLEDFVVDASQGSHFFHNLVAMDVGYFTVAHNSEQSYIDWKWLSAQPIKEKKKYFVHTELTDPVEVKIDGHEGFAIIDKKQR